jgi:hypothetical protein
MEMDFHFTEASLAEMGQGVEVGPLIGFQRIEERVARRTAVAVPEMPETPRVLLHPAIYSGLSQFRTCGSRGRFVVVRKAEEQVRGLSPLPGPALPNL